MANPFNGPIGASSAAPVNDDAQGRRAEGIKGQTHNKQAHCAAQQEPDQEGAQFARLALLASRRGVTLHSLAGGYLLCRWGHCKELQDLRAVSLVLRQMGVYQ